MNDLKLNDEEKRLLKEIIDSEEIEIVWDLNAFYFNTKIHTYKLECIEERPDGSDYIYDEISFCRFNKLKNKITFTRDDPKYWYKIIGENLSIDKIELLNICQVFPSDELIPSIRKSEFDNGINELTLGLIIKTDEGYIPAFLLPSRFGYDWQQKYGFHTQIEIEELISENIKYFEKINCT